MDQTNQESRKENSPDQLLLNVKQLADIINWSERSIYNRTGPRAKKRLPVPVLRVGRSIRFRRSDVLAFIDNLRPLIK
jgi:predicted DNA-binding transcriptional regulator AlpA